MKKFSLDYPLTEGYIPAWLATSPISNPVNAQPKVGENELEFRRRMLAQFSPSASQAAALPLALPPYGGDEALPPVELDRLGAAFWEVRRAREDHLLEASVVTPTWQHVQRWAFITLQLPSAGPLTLELEHVGAATLWVNGNLMLRNPELRPQADQQATRQAMTLRAKRGGSAILLLLEDVLLGPGLLSAGLRLSNAGGALENAAVKLWVTNAEINQRKAAEALYEIAYIAVPVLTRDDQVVLRAADRLVGSNEISFNLRSPDGSTHSQSFGELKPGSAIPSIYSYQLPAGPLELQLIPGLELFYNERYRPERIVPFLNAPFQVYQGNAGDYQERLVLLCKEMSRAGGVFGEMAKMMLGWWEILDLDELRGSLERVNQRAAGCLLDLLGLAGLAGRLTRLKKVPAELLPEIESALTGFPYAETAARCIEAQHENDLLLLSASRVLAGQKYTRSVFSEASRSGNLERKIGEEQAFALLQNGGRQGWQDGTAQVDTRVAALAHLLDLAKDEDLRELAGILLDQETFTLAQHSHCGALALPQLETSHQALRSLRLAPSAALNLLLFGNGCYNQHLVGAFSLGIASGYQLPAIISGIAQSQVEEAWTVERSAQAQLAAFKTPDSLLASLQDYHPGARGGRVNPWQATLGSEALVFTNHPDALNQSEARQAGTWCGSGVLPRVAQWKDALICLYNLPEHTPLNFTHAYFPTFAFDEYRHEQDWFFARKANAYLAIYASSAARLLEHGDSAYCELRAAGPQTAWLVQLGRQAVDGDFKGFCARVLGCPLSVSGLSVAWQTLRGERLSFDWSGPLLKDGKELPLSGGKRFEGPFVDAAFPAETMDIGYGEQLMRLTFS